MNEIVYKDYSQTDLDAEYNNQAKVADFLSYMKEGAALCATARKEYPDIKTICFDDASGQYLDIVYPKDRTNRPYPVQVFIHGGYWKALSKENFTFVARAFAEYGIATVIVDYQLIPKVTMDELVRQCRQSLAYLHRNASDLDLDPADIHISGHSAGGHLVAMCMGTDWSEFGEDLPVQIIKSGVGISGLYNLLPINLCYLQKDLKLDGATVKHNSPIHLKPPLEGNLHLTLGGLEGEEYLDQSTAMKNAWPNRTAEPIVLAPYNHFSIVNSLADPTSALSTLIRRAMGHPE
ncbi:MAG: alpha/beta hydrolase [Sneathiella sp.]|nr:alpha/beta hydrolase [Sneathiella sp.]